MAALTTEEHYTCVFLASVYGGLFALSFAQFVVLVRRNIKTPPLDTRRVFRLLSMAVCMLRTLYLLLMPYTFESDLSVDKRFLELSVPRITTLVYCSAYMILVVVWARLFYSIRESDPQTLSSMRIKIDRAYYYGNAFLYLIEIGFLSLYFVVGTDEDDAIKYYTLLTANTLFLGLITMFWAVGFVWFGFLVYLQVRLFAANSFLRTRELVYEKLRKVSIITIICTACFLARAILICFYTTLDHLENPPSSYYLVYLFNSIVGEIIPLLLVLTQASPVRVVSAERRISSRAPVVGAYVTYEDSDVDDSEHFLDG
eukprot:TRINITY_DN15895_c0_g1_i1.p1 TRINITY_DN15895_c0_g1~~TRINITY_DN15895_c0_g1_i1.p1  ORF type:complete len:314 (-),score=58.09 TRINITY_DN15895_c0_g1_i1:19-960(-)